MTNTIYGIVVMFAHLLACCSAPAAEKPLELLAHHWFHPAPTCFRMTSRDIIADLHVLDDVAEMSFYEDAPNAADSAAGSEAEEEEELHRVVQDAELHLKQRVAARAAKK